MRVGGDSSTVISVVTNKEYENRTADTTNDNFAPALGDTSIMVGVSGSTSEVVMSEHSKRPMCDDEAYRVESKRPKQVYENKKLDSFPEFPFSTCKELLTSGIYTYFLFLYITLVRSYSFEEIYPVIFKMVNGVRRGL